MDKAVLVIKTEMLLAADIKKKLYDDFLRQIEQGCIIIPPWFECQVVQVPENVEVIFEAPENNDIDLNFLTKRMNIPITPEPKGEK